jgi:hypothetical protein
MAPFVVLIVLFVLLSVLGHFQLPVPYGWWTSLRLASIGYVLIDGLGPLGQASSGPHSNGSNRFSSP